MASSSARMTPFEEWWKAKLADSMEKSGTIPSVAPQQAFEAGWLAAVKAHDESGCGIADALEFGKSL